MSAELYVKFEDRQWFGNNLLEMKKRVLSLSCSKSVSDCEYWLVENNKNSTDYDIRFFFEESHIFLEVSFYPKSIEVELSSYLDWLRSCTRIKIFDEDGVESRW